MGHPAAVRSGNRPGSAATSTCPAGQDRAAAAASRAPPVAVATGAIAGVAARFGPDVSFRTGDDGAGRRIPLSPVRSERDVVRLEREPRLELPVDRKSTRTNSSHY